MNKAKTDNTTRGTMMLFIPGILTPVIPSGFVLVSSDFLSC